MAAARLPAVSGKRVVRALTKAGFVVDRIAGSHYVLADPKDPTLRSHGSLPLLRDLKPGTLRAIIRQAGLTVEEFNALL